MDISSLTFIRHGKTSSLQPVSAVSVPSISSPIIPPGVYSVHYRKLETIPQAIGRWLGSAVVRTSDL